MPTFVVVVVVVVRVEKYMLGRIHRTQKRRKGVAKLFCLRCVVVLDFGSKESDRDDAENLEHLRKGEVVLLWYDVGHDAVEHCNVDIARKTKVEAKLLELGAPHCQTGLFGNRTVPRNFNHLLCATLGETIQVVRVTHKDVL